MIDCLTEVNLAMSSYKRFLDVPDNRCGGIGSPKRSRSDSFSPSSPLSSSPTPSYSQGTGCPSNSGMFYFGPPEPVSKYEVSLIIFQDHQPIHRQTACSLSWMTSEYLVASMIGIRQWMKPPRTTKSSYWAWYVNISMLRAFKPSPID